MKLKRSLCVLLIAVLTCVPAVAFAATYYVSHIEEGDYYICASADSRFALSVVGSVTTQGTYFHLWEKIEGNPDQIFTIEHISGDWYTIKVKKTSLCLNVPGGNNANGQQLWTWPFDDTDSCLFRFASTNDGNYIIQSKLGRALDLDNNLLFNGSRTHLWDPHEGASGRWKLERVGGSREDSFSSAVYDIAAAQSGKRDSAYGGGRNTPWCGYYARYVLKEAYQQVGVDYTRYIPYSELASATLTAEMYENNAAKYGKAYSFYDWSWSGRGMSKSNAAELAACKPKVGDLVLTNTSGTCADGPDHVALIIKVNADGSFVTSEGNTGSGTTSTRTVREYTYRYNQAEGTWQRNGLSSLGQVVVLCSVKRP